MLENYEPVAVRLHRLLETLRTAGESPRVITVMLSQPGADICVFRAELWLGDHLVATGHAEEVRNQGRVNETSHVENCETSSLGRMCEAFSPNPDWTKRPSREEMAKVQRLSPGTQGGVDRKFTGTKTIVNKMKGRCVNCSGPVEAGEGLAKNDGSGWKTYHHEGACVTVEEPF